MLFPPCLITESSCALPQPCPGGTLMPFPQGSSPWCTIRAALGSACSRLVLFQQCQVPGITGTNDRQFCTGSGFQVDIFTRIWVLSKKQIPSEPLSPFPTPELCRERLHTSTRSQPEAGLQREFCRGTGAGERLRGAKMSLQVVAHAPTVLNFTQTEKKCFFSTKSAMHIARRVLSFPILMKLKFLS